MCEEQAADPVFNDVFSRRYPDAPGLRAVYGQSLAFDAELIRDAQSCGTLRPECQSLLGKLLLGGSGDSPSRRSLTDNGSWESS
jgi:hypothetical protein